MEAEAVVVGAGPAGVAAAIGLARAGHPVLLLDRANFPRDKVCGEALSPMALPLLEELGVRELVEARSFHTRGLLLVAPGGARVRASYPGDAHGLSLPRRELDALLFEAARATPGVRAVTGVRVSGLIWEAGTCTGVRTPQGLLPARVVILAEGRHTRLHPGVRRSPSRHPRHALVQSFAPVHGLDAWLELFLVGPQLQIVVSPQGPERAALSVVLTDRPLPEPLTRGFRELLEAVPELAWRLRAAEPLGPLKGMELVPYTADPVPACGLVAVGDATGFFDPLTGEGMYRALRSGLLAATTVAHALEHGPCTRRRLAPYRRAMGREFAWTYRFVRSVVALTRMPRACDRAIRVLQRHPELAERMAAYQGALRPASGFFLDAVRLSLGR